MDEQGQVEITIKISFEGAPLAWEQLISNTLYDASSESQYNGPPCEILDLEVEVDND